MKNGGWQPTCSMPSGRWLSPTSGRAAHLNLLSRPNQRSLGVVCLKSADTENGNVAVPIAYITIIPRGPPNFTTALQPVPILGFAEQTHLAKVD